MILLITTNPENECNYDLWDENDGVEDDNFPILQNWAKKNS
jgi:hypothetical protein